MHIAAVGFSLRKMNEFPVALLIASLPTLDHRGTFQGIPGLTPSLMDRPRGCSFQPRCPVGREIPECQAQTPQPHTVEGTAGRATVECHFADQRIGEVRA